MWLGERTSTFNAPAAADSQIGFTAFYGFAGGVIARKVSYNPA